MCIVPLKVRLKSKAGKGLQGDWWSVFNWILCQIGEIINVISIQTILANNPYYKEALKQKIAHLGERFFLFIFFYSAAVVSSAADSSPSDSSPSAGVSSAADSSSLGS